MNTDTKCKSCGAEIVFVLTEKGHKMPVDAGSWNGEAMYHHGVHVSHFSTCKNADKHRKKSKGLLTEKGKK